MQRTLDTRTHNELYRTRHKTKLERNNAKNHNEVYLYYVSISCMLKITTVSKCMDDVMCITLLVGCQGHPGCIISSSSIPPGFFYRSLQGNGQNLW